MAGNTLIVMINLYQTLIGADEDGLTGVFVGDTVLVLLK